MALTVLDTAMLDTWPKVLEHNSQTLGRKHVAMRYKHYGIWQSLSWLDYYSAVKYLALGLLSLGFQPGDKLLIVGDNSPQWYFAELAAQCNRGVSVGLYSDLSAGEIECVARSSEARFAMVEDQEQVDKLMSIRDRLPALTSVIYWRYKGLSGEADPSLIGLREVVELGHGYDADHPKAFQENISAGKAGDICAIIYTSGTTGDPKGALHSYESLMTDALYYYKLDRLSSKDNFASYLPPAWISEQSLAFGCHLLSGGTVDFAEDSETQPEDVRETAPSVVVYNSRLWETLAGQVRARMRGASVLKRRSSDWLLPVGFRLAELREQGRRPDPLHWLLGGLGDLLVFRRVRDSLGLTRARVCYSYGCTLSPETMRFFHALKVPLKNVYSSAEAGSVTGVGGRVQTLGTVGSINEGVEVRLTAEGELAVRHPGAFLGYCNDPQATALALRDGWVMTGDRCQLSDRELVLLDRMDDLITIPCGDVIAPQEVESRLKYSPYIRDAWVLAGPGCDWLSGVIIVDAANVGHWADKQKVIYTTFADLSQKPEVYRLIEQEIAFVNSTLPESRRIKRFVNLHKEFDPDEAELTRNGKLRRAVLAKRYPDLVDALADNVSSVEIEAEFIYQDGRTGRLKTAVRVRDVGEAAEE